MRGEVVGVELAHADGGGARRRHRGGLGVEPIGAARSQDDGRAGRQPRRHLEADLAAAAEDHDQPRVSRVLHGSDYACASSDS